MNFLYLLTGIIYGWIEAFAMEHGFSTGEMDFFGFKKAYHGAMLLLTLTIGYAIGCLDEVFWWVLVEDLTFFASSKWGPRKLGFTYKFKLTQDSWIAKMMGSLKYKNVMVPIVYVFLFIVGLASVYYL